MNRSGLTVALLLMVAAMPASGISEVAWSTDGAPAATAVQSIGGAAGVLVASTFTEGAWRSTDDGLTWQRIAGFPAVTKGRVAFDPTDASVGYVAGFGGVARTLDGGQTWTQVLAVARAARIDVGPTGLLLVGARYADTSNHVLRSSDRGATWTDLGAPLPNADPLCGVAFGRSPAEVLTMTNKSSWYTHDGGHTWTETPGAGFDFAIEDSGVVWRGDMRLLHVTRDGGATWEDVQPPGFGTALGARPGGGVYVATTEGLLTTADSGATWTNYGFGNAFLLAHGVFAPAWAPDAPFVADELVGVARLAPDETGGFTYEGRTQGFPRVGVHALGGGADGSFLLGATAKGLYASRDGAPWQHTGAGIGPASLVALAAGADGSTAYVGGRSAFGPAIILASRDGGLRFDGVELPGGAGETRGLAVDPTDPLHAFAGVVADDLTGAVYETLDGGVTWGAVLDPLPPVHDLAWDAASGSLLVATDAGVVARDASGLWVPRGSLQATAVAAEGGFAYAAGLGGLWRGGPALVPWADPGAVVDLAAGADVAWVAGADGVLSRCAAGEVLGACAEDGPPAALGAVLIAPGRVVAGGPDGLWWTPA